MDKKVSREQINRAIKNNDAASLVSALSDEDKKLLDTLLKDEKARKEFLSSKEAGAIISALFKGR